MNKKHFIIGSVAGTLLLILFLIPVLNLHRSPPDFADIRDVDERKTAFFEFLLPFIRKANVEIRREREQLENLRKKQEFAVLNKRDLWWLKEHARTFGIDLENEQSEWDGLIEELGLRMDEIPPSLALAQASLESAWGTSRFAEKGNNLFGIRCYTPGCGTVPHLRPAGASYEVTSYSSPLGSFKDYMTLLNSSPAYRQLWALRKNARLNGDSLEGSVLAGGLRRYSSEGDAYIQKVRQMIRDNRLQKFDP